MECLKKLFRLPDPLVGRQIEKCNDCPFFYDGGNILFTHICKAGGSEAVLIERYDSSVGSDVIVAEIPEDCPIVEN